MSRTSLQIAVALLLYLPLGLCGADALAGAVFTLANKQMPENLSLTSWPDSWRAYREDPIQRKRLQFSAVVGGFVGFGLPALLLVSLRRDLHLIVKFNRPGSMESAESSLEKWGDGTWSMGARNSCCWRRRPDQAKA